MVISTCQGSIFGSPKGHQKTTKKCRNNARSFVTRSLSQFGGLYFFLSETRQRGDFDLAGIHLWVAQGAPRTSKKCRNNAGSFVTRFLSQFGGLYFFLRETRQHGDFDLAGIHLWVAQGAPRTSKKCRNNAGSFVTRFLSQFGGLYFFLSETRQHGDFDPPGVLHSNPSRSPGASSLHPLIHLRPHPSLPSSISAPVKLSKSNTKKIIPPSDNLVDRQRLRFRKRTRHSRNPRPHRK